MHSWLTDMKILEYSSKNFWTDLQKSCANAANSPEAESVAKAVIEDVRKRGDKALFEATKKFDRAYISAKNIRVSGDEILRARKLVSKRDADALKDSIKNVSFFNSKTKPKNWRAKNPHGATVGENFYPIDRVGLYIPGGQAPLVSTVIMTCTLAKIAGCREICVCTPPAPDGSINAHLLRALDLLGIREIYKVGGAQAIAAMAIGTKSIKPVDKIFGPGNAFVIGAKRILFGEVGIDLLPGPSEVLIIADGGAKPEFVAADLLSQAEHGSGKEKIYFITVSKPLAEKVKKELPKQAKSLSRAEKLLKIIDVGTCIIHVPNLEAAAETANFIAPEHMELHLQAPEAEKLSKLIHTAGAVLVGEETPTVLGDFCAGPSHTLPTGRTGRFSSGLQVSDFMRRSSYVKYSKANGSCKRALKTVAEFAKMESLDAHGRSLEIRLD